jgi:hypothetical protein
VIRVLWVNAAIADAQARLSGPEGPDPDGTRALLRTLLLRRARASAILGPTSVLR